MTVPEGWTMSSTELGSTRFGQKGELKRVACEDLPRDFPEDEAPDANCALVMFGTIDTLEALCDDSIEPHLGSSFDDLVTYVAGPTDHRERRRDGRWLPREAPPVLAGRGG